MGPSRGGDGVVVAAGVLPIPLLLRLLRKRRKNQRKIAMTIWDSTCLTRMEGLLVLVDFCLLFTLTHSSFEVNYSIA